MATLTTPRGGKCGGFGGFGGFDEGFSSSFGFESFPFFGGFPFEGGCHCHCCEF